METQPIIINGTVDHVTFYNLDTGWGVLRVRVEGDLPPEAQDDGTINVVGVMPELVAGESAQFEGHWVNNPQYGRQLKTEQVYPRPPGNERGIIEYLRNTVYGVGEATAKRIYKHFGDKTIEILDANPEAAREVPGLKPNIAQNLIDAWTETRQVRQIMIYLQSYGVTMALARRIYEQYGNETLQIVQNDPYQLADELHGIGFKKADLIARGMGMAEDAPERLRAGLLYALSQLANDGHTYAPRTMLLEKAGELLGVEDAEMLYEALRNQVRAGFIFEDKLYEDGTLTEALYLPRFFRAEVSAAKRLRMLATSPSKIIMRTKDVAWEAYLAELSQANEVDLTPQQQSAVQAALTRKVTVLTGGPGTGKTTTLQMVINALRDKNFSFMLASPTGRAAKRLAEATKHEAKTIHRTLGYIPQQGYEFTEDNPLQTDMLIIDEASMIDLMLFASVLKALDAGTHLMLVGDVDQLPSVGAGNVLRDVINSGVAHVTRLNQIFRQSAKSHIVSNAHRINKGEQPVLDNKSEDFFLFSIKEPQAIGGMVVDIVQNRVRERFDLDPMTDVQVIAPMYRGPAGVDALNKALQAALNNRSDLASKRLGGRIFRVRDKVMQTRNDYDKDVFNGDIGQLYAIDEVEEIIQVDMNGRIVNYSYRDAEENLLHAYCISTHRSQGSEYPVVVMPIMMGHWIMLQRNLLYTAITRAKKVVVLVGERRAVYVAVENNKVAERHSGLRARLQSAAHRTLL